MTPRRVVLLAALLLATGAAADSAPDPRDLSAQVTDVQSQLKTAEDNLRIVETQWTMRPEPTDRDVLEHRFSDGEIQYLLGDYPGCSVLFYDLVSDQTFRASPHYPEALFYLADALYKQQNFIGAKLYFRELVQRHHEHYQEALAKYVEIAGRLNEFIGIDDYIKEARGTGGALPPELAYVYGKWLFKRTDLALHDRLERAQEVFAPLANDPKSPYRLQAAYFVAVGYVEAGDYPRAIEQFRAISNERAQNDREIKVKELANLSMGRVLYEAGKYDEALDRYQEIPRESDFFPDSLYETAWVQVKKGEFEKAKDAVDILLLVAEGSTLEPDAKILRGHLLLKLKRYNEANDAYNEVINQYAPVRDEIDALLSVNRDPVTYFDNLLARNEKSLDINSLLPPVALKWASTQQEVTEAVQIVDDLEGSRRAVGDSQEIAQRVLSALDKRGMESFPALQEGYTRVEAIDSALTQANDSLTRIEHVLVENQLTPAQRDEFDQLRQKAADLAQRFKELPSTQEELQARRKRLQDRVDTADKEAFKLGYEVQSMFAVLTAVDKWLEDTKGQRHSSPEDEKAFVERLEQERENLNGLTKQLDEVRQALAAERHSADTSVAGEDQIRQQYEEVLKREHELLGPAEARLGADGTQVLNRAHQTRTEIAQLRQRVEAAKGVLRDQVARKGQEIRDKIHAEQALLDGYGQEVTHVSGSARNLVGRIAFDSFKRVRQQFYDLVLKADVGLVDVAFTRKQDNTLEIQKLAAQKDKELKELDDEFKEVLKDVD